MPHPLVNVFSGGIHGASAGIPFQQIMILPRFPTAAEDIRAAVAVYDAVEAEMKAKSLLVGYSASSGLLAASLDYRGALDIVRETVARLGHDGRIDIAFDAAAEHLKSADGSYRIGDRRLSGEELLELYCRLADDYPIGLIEDPFDPADTALWRRLTAAVGHRVSVVGDDLFATDPANITGAEGTANAVLLKMNQVGTVTATLRAVRAVRACEMKLYVSHRSCETDDTAMCDLAVAVAADAIKIGGPRRGDRIGKYNRLLELAEHFGA